MKKFSFILALVLPLYVIRFKVFFIPTNLFEILAIIFILIWLLKNKFGGVSKLWKTFSNNYIFWLFGIISFIGLINTNQTLDSLGIWKSYFIIPLILGMIFINNQKLYYCFIKGLITSSLYVSGISMLQVLLVGFRQDFRPVALYNIGLDPAVSQGGFANYIGMYLTPIIFLSLYINFTKNQKTNYFITGFLILGNIITQSYISILAMISGFFIYFGIVFISSKKINIKKITVSFSIIILVLIGFIAWQSRTAKFQNLFDLEKRNSITTRIQIWDTTFSLIREKPILGYGLADFQTNYEREVPKKYFPPFEWLVPEPHNLYLAFWFHTGILGIIWLGLIIKKSIYSLLSNKNILWLNISFASILIYGLFDTVFWKNDLAVLFMIVLIGLFITKKAPKNIRDKNLVA